MLELATNQRPKLSAIANLYDALHENSIVYCNLKGNEKHLLISMTGESDIDILFDEHQKAKLEPVLNKLGFKKFNAIKPKQYRDIVDFLALDLESGKVIHLHTHYRLTIGEPYLKGYQLDIENYILNGRVFNEEFGMYCIRPSVELILLYLIESLKLRHRDLILMSLTGKWNASQKNIYEYNWLKKRITDDELQASLKQIFNDHTRVSNLLGADFSRKQLHRLAPVIKKEFRKYRLYSPLHALLLRWYREVVVSVLRKLPRILARPVLSMRVNPRGGIIVAVTGNNRVSQSTLTDLLKAAFAKKMDVYRITFKKREDKWGEDNQLKTALSGQAGWLSLLYKRFRSIVAARDCWNKMRLAQMAKNNGALVICDHYPQNQIAGSHDGSVFLNSPSAGSRFFRILASIELKMYAHAASYYPDIVFNLTGSPEDSEGKRPGETFREDAAAKNRVTAKQVIFNRKYKVITLVAAKPVKELLDILKREIWNIL